jgi:microcin C transport system substrate-binding protein
MGGTQMTRKILAMLSFLLLLVLTAQAKIITANSICLHGNAKYPADFTHFDYVNPNAPKGGTLSSAAIGTYDSFNRYAMRGNPDYYSFIFFDNLMAPSADEPETYYALIAEKIEYPDDYSYVTFYINPKAKFQDGKPITADDVIFSYNKFFTEGLPQFKLMFKDVVLKIEALDQRKVKFTLKNANKETLISLAANLSILPKQYWNSHNLGEPLAEIPLGSSAYTVKDFKLGEYVVYQLITNYWAADLPVNKGQNNYAAIRYDYYRDLTVAFEAFKAGEFDFWMENSAKNWATLYTGPQFDSKKIIKEELTNEIPKGMQGFFMNVQRPVFSDRRVRMAVAYALDFEWMNKNLFYNQYTRMRSYFANTDYEAKGLPSPEELKILNPLRGKIPEEVFTKEYNPPVTDGTGNIRKQIEDALALLKEAGWEIRNEVLVNVKTGKPMEFELILDDPSYQRIAIPFQNNLNRLGIKMTIRVLDSSQYQNRAVNRDFDMISTVYSPSFYPDSGLKSMWRSNYTNSTYNIPGVTDKAVDTLIDGIMANQENEKALLAYGRALDRVLTWNSYVIPQWTLNKFRLAYWDKFSRPAILPRYDSTAGVTSVWWLDTAKEAKLPSRNAKK